MSVRSPRVSAVFHSFLAVFPPFISIIQDIDITLGHEGISGPFLLFGARIFRLNPACKNTPKTNKLTINIFIKYKFNEPHIPIINFFLLKQN